MLDSSVRPLGEISSNDDRFLHLMVSLCGTTVVVLFAGFLYWLSLFTHDEIVETRALYDLNKLVQQETPFAWDFTDPISILAYEQYGIGDLVFNTDGMNLVASNHDPYFWLNLKGRTIDTKRYHQLILEMYSEKETEIGFIFGNEREDGRSKYRNIMASELVPIKAGWQTLVLDLSDIAWNIPGCCCPVEGHWGGQNYRASSLRVDLGNHLSGNVYGFKKAELVFDRSFEAVDLDSVTTVSVTQGDGIDDAMIKQLANTREKGLVVIDQSSWRTAEYTMKYREQIQEINPGAILFPRPLDFKQRLISGEADIHDVNFNPNNLAVKVMFIAALLMFATLVISFIDYKAIVEGLWLNPIVTIPLFIGYTSSLWILSSAAADLYFLTVLGGFFAFYCLQLIKHRDGSWRERLGLIRAPARLWSITASVTLVTIALIVLMGYYFDTFGQIDRKMLLKNLVQYPLWGVLQQMLLGPIISFQIFALLKRVCDSEYLALWLTAISSAFIFGLLHTPNFVLMECTFVFGVIWSSLYLRYGSIIPLAICHGLIATLFRELAPEMLRADGDIGLGFYHSLWVEN